MTASVAVTERPWKWTNGNLIRVVGPSAEVIAGVHKIGRYLGDHGAVDLARANAAHIVLAVNAFDEMKAALEGARSWLAMVLASDKRDVCYDDDHSKMPVELSAEIDALESRIAAIDAALSLATGATP